MLSAIGVDAGRMGEIVEELAKIASHGAGAAHDRVRNLQSLAMIGERRARVADCKEREHNDDEGDELRVHREQRRRCGLSADGEEGRA